MFIEPSLQPTRQLGRSKINPGASIDNMPLLRSFYLDPASFSMNMPLITKLIHNSGLITNVFSSQSTVTVVPSAKVVRSFL